VITLLLFLFYVDIDVADYTTLLLVVVVPVYILPVFGLYTEVLLLLLLLLFYIINGCVLS
jgi:hypothetical protein